MPIDHYKMSMETKPLRLLYSKYAPQAPLAPGSIRPLGSVRRCESSGHDEQVISLTQLEGEVSKTERVQRYLAMSGGGHGLLDMYGSRKSLHSLTSSSENSRLPGNNRSRSQDFENKYKIAMSRGPQDHKVPNIYNKKVIQLPLLKINLETYVGDTEDNRALESTRKSLRHILDVGRKPAGIQGGICVKQAGITQYHFKTPAEIQREEALRLSIYHQSPDFYTTDEGHISHRKEDSREDREPSLRLESVGEDDRTISTSGTLGDKDVIVERPEEEELEEDMFDRDLDNSSVMAQRLSSAATLGTSYRYLDLERFSSDAGGFDQSDTGMYSRQRTRIEGVGNLDKLGDVPMWPSFEDMKNLRPEYGHACLAIKPRMHQEVRFLERGSSVIMQRAPPDSFVIRNGVIPKLKYTTHYSEKPNSKRKLDPIVSAPHTARECPMCNLFKVKEPTPCPPNTPRAPGDLLPEIGTTINQDSLGGEDVEDPNEDDDTDRSDVEFRKRHNLLHYNIADVSNTPRILRTTDNGKVPKEVTTEYRFRNAKTSR